MLEVRWQCTEGWDYRTRPCNLPDVLSGKKVQVTDLSGDQISNSYTGLAVEIGSCKMSLLLRRKGGLFSKEYELMDKDSVVCFMQFDDWKDSNLLIEGKRYFVRANGQGRWSLEESGISIAGSQRQGTGPRLTLTVSFDSRSWLLKPRRKGLILHHDIWEDDCVVGQIANTIGLWSSGLSVTSPETARIEIVSFAVWLIGIHGVSTAGKLTAARAELGL